MKRLTCILLLFLSLGAHSATNGEAFLEQAQSLEVAGQVSKAIQIYQKALASGDVSEKALVALVRILSASKQYEEASKEVSNYLKNANPFSLEAHLLMGDLYIKMGKFHEALNEADVSNRLQLENIRGLELRGVSHFRLGDFEKAIEVLTALLKKEPSHVSAKYFRAHALVSLNQWDLALQDFRNLAEEFPLNNEYQDFLATCYLKLQRWNEAEKILTTQLRSNPTSIDTLARLAEAYTGLNRSNDVITSYKKIINIDAKNFAAVEKLADTYWTLKQYDLAVPEYLKLVKAKNGDQISAQKLISIWTLQKQLEVAGTFLREYVNQWPSSVWGTSQYVQKLVQIGSFDLALDFLEKSPRDTDEMKLAHQLLKGHIFYKSGKLKEAEAVLISAEKKWPNDGRIPFNLGIVYSSLKDHKMAAQSFKKVPASEIFYKKSVVNLALAYEASGMINEAEEKFSELQNPPTRSPSQQSEPERKK